jgi:hypothetical protein
LYTYVFVSFVFSKYSFAEKWKVSVNPSFASVVP